MIRKIALTILLLLAYVKIIAVFSSVYIADVFFVMSEDLLASSRTDKALETINKSIKYNSNEPNYYKQRAKVFIAATVDSDENNKKNLKKLAHNDLKTALEKHPKNLATIRNTAPLYFFLANTDLSQPAGAENIDNTYLEISQKYFVWMQEYVPNDVGVQVLAAKYQKRLGLTEDYAVSRNRIKDLRPDLLEWHSSL